MLGLDPTALQQFADALSAVGLLGGAIVLIWLLLTERLVPAGRLRDERDVRITAEKQRDEAIEGWRLQSEATKTVAAEQTKTLEYMRDVLPRRRAAS